MSMTLTPRKTEGISLGCLTTCSQLGWIVLACELTFPGEGKT